MAHLTNEEKVTHIRTAAMEEARAEANAIVKQHEDALRSVFEQHQIEARRQSETRVRAESVTAKQQLNMAMSKAQLELKREMGKTQTELKTELFEEVQLKLLAFMRTEEYKEVLIRYIEKAAQFASGMAMTIYINPSDADKKTYLEERTGMTLTTAKWILSAGCVRLCLRRMSWWTMHSKVHWRMNTRNSSSGEV